MPRALRTVMIAIAASFVTLVLAFYGARVSPAEAPSRTPTPTSLAASRFFMLLPDGRVEITDAVSRRVFRWDGQRWVETESRSRPRPDSR